MKTQFLAGLVGFCLATGAGADIRAVYQGEYGGATVVEIANGGAIRIGRAADPYADYELYLGDEAFRIIAGPGGPIVLTMGAAEVLAQYELAQTVVFGDDGDGVRTEPEVWTPVERVTIAGIAGQRLELQGALYPELSRLVLTDAPELRPLGVAFLRARETQDRLAGAPDAGPDPLASHLRNKGVLAIDNLELMSVGFDAIDPARFALPGKPVSAKTMRKQLGQPSTEMPDVAESRVMSAAFHKGRLYTLHSDGRVTVWRDGAANGRDMAVPDRVSALCAMGGALYAVTGAAPRGEPAAAPLTLWQAEGGADWRAVATVEARRRQSFLALDCSGKSPGMLMSGAFHLPLEGRVIRLGGAKLGDGPSYVTLQKDGLLYVGSDMGEWGGGLWRYALEGKTAGRPQDRGRCGLAGKDCLNITGLAPDPRDPACVLVAVGLLHFAPSGRISRLCGAQISLVYAKPMTVETDWVFAGDLPEEAWPQVAFTGLVMAGGEVWAMGTDGLYRFGQTDLPEFQGFAPFGTFPASGVDWSHPDHVLVSSSAMRRHAANGGGLLLVPRRE